MPSSRVAMSTTSPPSTSNSSSVRTHQRVRGPQRERVTSRSCRVGCFVPADREDPDSFHPVRRAENGPDTGALRKSAKPAKKRPAVSGWTRQHDEADPLAVLPSARGRRVPCHRTGFGMRDSCGRACRTSLVLAHTQVQPAVPRCSGTVAPTGQRTRYCAQMHGDDEEALLVIAYHRHINERRPVGTTPLLVPAVWTMLWTNQMAT